MYKADFEQYVGLTKTTEEEAKADYDANINSIVEQFETLELSEKLVSEYESFFVKLRKSTKYEIKEVRKDDAKNYEVDVEVQPLQVFEGIGEEAMAQIQSYAEELVAAGAEIPSDAEINERYFQNVCDLLTEKINHATYGKKQTFTVHVVKGEHKVYGISEEEFTNLDAIMYDIDNMKI